MKTGHHDPIRITHRYLVGAWTFDVGVSEGGDWVVEALSVVCSRPQRLYFATEEEATAYVKSFAT